MNKKNKPYHNAIQLNSDLMEILVKISGSNSTTVTEYRRIHIIIHYHNSSDSFKHR